MEVIKQEKSSEYVAVKYDNEIEIAIGKNRKELNWKNKQMLWSEFLNRVSSTIRTTETYKEYISSAKGRQDEIKDVGGFVGGTLAGGKRKYDTVLNRRLICLDIDHTKDMGVWERYKILYGNAGLIYTTHKHTKSNPRFRLIIPLKVEIAREQYEPIARKIAGDLGIDSFDDTTFEVCRLMYFPSTAKDGEFIFEYCDDKWLDPQEILDSYSNWKDSSSWALSSRVDKIIERAIKKQGDPIEKAGLIGAFCRTYTIQEAIDTFLANEYEPCSISSGARDRYTYKYGSTAAGLILYEDKFAFSHHGTDPARGKLCNAFDLVRIHRFGLMDENVKGNIFGNKLPSYSAMVEFCSEDNKTKSLMIREKLDSVREDFKDYAEEEEKEQDNDDWLENLSVDSKGRIKSTIDNIVLVFENDYRVKNKICINELEHTEVAVGRLPWRKKDDTSHRLTNVDKSSIRHFLEKNYNIVGEKKIRDAIAKIAYDNSFHPIKDYLNSLSWDGINRIDTLFIDYLGVENSEYTRTVTRKALVACIARIFKAGCKFDYVLTLVGKQGIGKSTIIKELARDWFSDSLDTVIGKEAYEQLQGVWIIELGELAVLKKAEQEHVKRFITKREDRYRVAYGEVVESFPRQCVFFATSNPKDFLNDPTGGRRWWVLDTMTKEPIKDIFTDLTKYEIDQIWAEAYQRYKDGEELYLSKEMEEQANIRQEEHTYRSDKVGLIEEYLELELPECWDTMDIQNRQNYIHNENFRLNFLEDKPNLFKRDKVCVAEIYCELFRGFQKDMSSRNTKDLHNIMRKLNNWEEIKLNRFKIYGAQKAYKRQL